MYSLKVQTVIVLLYHLFATIGAQTVQNLLWNIPDGKATDLSLTFTNGVTLPLSWNNWTSTSYIDASQTLVDLWATSYDYNLNQYAEVLKSGIDLTVPGNYAWTIAISDKYLSVSAKYVLRFKIPATSYNADTPQLSSPGFLVLKGSTSSSAVTSSATSTTSSSTAPSSTLPPQTASVTSAVPSSSSTALLIASQSPSGLSTGAKAGLGIGITLGVLAIVALVAFLMVRRRRKQNLVTAPVYAEEKRYNDGPVMAPYVAEPAELPGGRASVYPSELDGS